MIVISFIGYKTQVLPAAATMNVPLQDDTEVLDDVVVIGYGSVKKNDATGSVTAIKPDELSKGITTNAQDMLTGKVAGVSVISNDGTPGGGAQIRIRGGSSLNASNDPLIVIDGLAIDNNGVKGMSNGLSLVNPEDIETFTVLKDASATAIYGSRASNGVIIITTKKGKAGMRQLDYSFNLGISNVAKKLDVLTGDEYRNTVSELGLTLDDKGENTDWQDVIFRTAISQNHYVSFMSGSENTSYRASAGYSNQNGIMEGSGMKSANARVNINHKALNDKLKLNMNISYGETNSDQAPVSNTVGSEMGSSMLYEAYVFNPTYPIYDEDGDYYDVPPYRVNPASFSKELLDERATSQFLGNLTADWNFYKAFTLQVNAGYNKNTINRNSYISKSIYWEMVIMGM